MKAMEAVQQFLIQGANLQTGTAYTLVLTDNNKIVSMSNAASNTVTIPPNSSVGFPVGATISVRQAGAGTTAVAPGTGVTLNSRGGLRNCAGQFAYVTIIKIATDTWDLVGDLA